MEHTKNGQSGAVDQTVAESEQLERLVRKAQAGDRAAFQQLVEKFQAKLFRTLYYRTHSHSDAEDMMQDVFLNAFKNLKGLKSPQLFRPWLYRIAVNRVRDHYRRKKMLTMLGFSSSDEEGFQEPSAPLSYEVVAQRREAFWAQIRKIMEKMSRLEKEVFYLRFFDELSIREITTVLKKKESTVKTHLYRALAKIKAAARPEDLRLDGLPEDS